jgi:hypothetical protein
MPSQTQNSHQQDFLHFSALVLDIPEQDRNTAWGIAHRKNFRAAIEFCQKILPKC